MIILAKNELEDIFVDVRKAYRLLYFYQRRIMDTADFVANLLSMHIVSGYSLYSSNPPRNGSSLNIDRWSWDWLNMYSYEFYLGHEIVDGNKYELAIAFNADSGFDDSDEDVTAIDVERFPPPEECVTKVYLYMGKNTWKPEDFELSWKKSENDEYEKVDGDKVFISKRYDLSDFADETSIRKNISSFKKLVKAHSITELWESE